MRGTGVSESFEWFVGHSYKARIDPPAPVTSKLAPTAFCEVAAKRGHHRIAQRRQFWQRALSLTPMARPRGIPCESHRPFTLSPPA
jgi:hypothetical protein